MNTILNFIFDVVSLKSSSSSPVGLTGLNNQKFIDKPAVVNLKKKDICLTDLMRRPR